jgi:hypothetical protein
MLKGKVSSIFEDTTYRNRCLIWDLSQRPEVERAWNRAGVIWAKLHNRETKIRVEITDDLDVVLNKPPGTPSARGRRRKPKQQRLKKTRKTHNTNGPMAPTFGPEPEPTPDTTDPENGPLVGSIAAESLVNNEVHDTVENPTPLVITDNIGIETTDGSISTGL